MTGECSEFKSMTALIFACQGTFFGIAMSNLSIFPVFVHICVGSSGLALFVVAFLTTVYTAQRSGDQRLYMRTAFQIRFMRHLGYQCSYSFHIEYNENSTQSLFENEDDVVNDLCEYR
ncbi:hypothetical protein HHI36_015130 [Cryptolaemus montrouzieri]|uniref:Uncharacterized protein n=1 Tax=Cryptolaemus montrouzieri TaxID=559131 RepID=A0ABD2N4S7_9CUCU